VLAAVDVVLAVYSFVDHDNRVYGNVISAFLSFILSGMLSLYILNGSIGETIPAATQKIVNWSGVNQTTTYVYANQTVVMQDISLGYVFSFGSVAMFIIMILFIIDARSEISGGEEEGD
jgi:hypothetical protein